MEGGRWQPDLIDCSAHIYHMPVLQMGPLQAAEMAGACGGRALAAQLMGMTITSGTATAADLIAAVRGEDNGLTDSLQRWACTILSLTCRGAAVDIFAWEEACKAFSRQRMRRDPQRHILGIGLSVQPLIFSEELELSAAFTRGNAAKGIISRATQQQDLVVMMSCGAWPEASWVQTAASAATAASAV